MKRFFFLMGLLLTLMHLNAEEDGDVSSIPLPAIYCGSESHSISIINPSANPPGVVKEIQGSSSTNMISVRAMSANSEGFSYYVYSANGDENTVSVINATEGKTLKGKIDVGGYAQALTSVIADGVPYIYCAAFHNNDYANIIVINGNEFAKNPTQPEKFIVKTIRVRSYPVALDSAIIGSTPYVYYLSGYDKGQLTVINAITQVQEGNDIAVGSYPQALTSATVRDKAYFYCTSSSLDDREGTVWVINADTRQVVQKVSVGNEAVALTSTKVNGDSYVYCALYRSGNLVIIDTDAFKNSENLNPQAQVVKSIHIQDYPIALTSVTVNGTPYVYCSGQFNKKVKVIKQKNDETIAKVVGSIILKSSASCLTTVKPTRDASVNNTSSNKAINKEGGSVGAV